MYVADTLSRAYLSEIDQQSIENAEEMNITIHSLIHNPSMTDDCIMKIREATEHDETLNLLKKTVYNGWPHRKKSLPQMLRPYWNFKASIHIVNDVLLVDNKIIIPKAMKNKMLTLLHEGHFGMIKTRARANESMYWPGIKNDIEEMCSKYATCNKYKNQSLKEPLINHDVPLRAFQKV